MSIARNLRVGFLLPRYPRQSRSLMPAIVRALADAGALVDVIHPMDTLLDLSTIHVEHDLYVLRHTSGIALSLAGALHDRGATIVNPYPASSMLRDKVMTVRRLQAAGIPTPVTYLAASKDDLRPLLSGGAIVVKPYDGSGGHQIRVIRNEAELEALDHGRDALFAQRYHDNDGRDRKIYAVGGRLFGVMKVFPRRTDEEKYGEPFTLTPRLRDIAERCGHAFGIDLFGVDIVESDGLPYVVDMCSIPGFKGVPDAVEVVTRYLYEAAARAAHGMPAYG